MKVKDLMTSDVRTCTPETTVAEAAHLMWDGDCGILPVVDAGALIGIVTDRDMYIALATRNALASQLRVGAVASKRVVTCAPEDDLQAALASMTQAKVRRLPVIGFGGTVLGLLSMDDVVLAAGNGRRGLKSDEIVKALQGIYGHHHPTPHVVAV